MQRILQKSRGALRELYGASKSRKHDGRVMAFKEINV